MVSQSPNTTGEIECEHDPYLALDQTDPSPRLRVELPVLKKYSVI